jgi:hypothetical protein
LRHDIVKKLVEYLETDQICYIEDKTINYIYKNEKLNLNELIKRVFTYLDETFDVKLKRVDNLLLSDSDSEFNKENIKSYLDTFVVIIKIGSLDYWFIGTIDWID